MNYDKLFKMHLVQKYSQLWIVKSGFLLFILSLCMVQVGYSAGSTNPLLREFSITVDPTALAPPTSWQVPGVTPLIYTMDPISSDAFKTTADKELRLKPGQYRFGTFTFDFPFTITHEGLLQFAASLDQCVKGRGTHTLSVTCSHTQPYPQEPDY